MKRAKINPCLRCGLVNSNPCLRCGLVKINPCLRCGFVSSKSWLRCGLVIVVLGLAAACCSGPLRAQQPALAAAPSSPRVGVMNLLEILDKCERYKKLKADLEAERAPFIKEQEDIQKIVEQWQKAFKNKDLKQEIREQGYNVLKEARRRYEDIDYRLKTEVAKHQEAKLKEFIIFFNKRVDEYARGARYDLVIAYGDLPDNKAIGVTATATDKGLVRPMIYPGMPPGVEITQDILAWLARP